MSSKKVKPEMTTEMPAEVSAFAQKSVDQAQAAFEKASDLAHSNVQVFDAAASAYKARFTDMQMKAMELTQNNVNALFSYARKLLSVKEPAEVFSVHQDFMREQASVLQRQAAEMNDIVVALAKETTKPVQEGWSKTFGELSKTAA